MKTRAALLTQNERQKKRALARVRPGGHALCLHEAGIIKSTPQKILAQGSDWRLLNELEKELKG